MTTSEPEAAASLAPVTLHSNERPSTPIVPGNPVVARQIAFHQRNLGNRAAQRFVGTTTIARKAASPAESGPQATSAIPEVAASAPVAGPATAAPPQAAPPASPGQPAGSASSPPPAASGKAPAGGGAGPLDVLKILQGAAPSELSQRLASAGQAAGAALGSHRTELEGLLPSQPAPSGMSPGTDVAAPEVPDVPRPDANASTGDAADPGAADHLGGAGSAAVGQLAGGANITPPNATQSVRPTVESGELPALAIEAPHAVAGEAPAVHADGATQKALDANLGATIHEQIASILAPASAAGIAHAAAVTSTHAEAKKQLATAESSTKSDQESATASADREIHQLLASWGKEKTSIIGQHQTEIQSESRQAKTAASQTLAEANAQAKAKAAESEKNGEQAKPSGLWDRVKAVGKSVVAGIGNVVGAVAGVIKGIIDAAREKVAGLITRLKQVVTAAIDRAVKAIRAGVQRVAGAVTSALRKAQALVTRLAKALVSLATKIWQAAAQKLKQLWTKLQAAIQKAIAAVRKAVQLVVKAVGMIREILKVFGNKTYAFIAELVKDPQGKIVAPIVAKAAPMAAAVPAKAEEAIKQHGPAAEVQAPGPAPAVASPTVNRSLQRSPQGEIQRAPTAAPAGEGFWAGVWRHLKGAGEDFKANWGMMLTKTILGILLLFPMLMEELPAIWTELKGLFVGTKDGMDRLDHFIGVCRHLVNIVAGAFAFVGVWALLLAWLGGPIAEGFTLAGYEGISAGIIAADIVVSIAQMTKSAVGATRTGVSTMEREGYLSRFVGGGIGFAITIVMVALGAIAQQFAKAIRAMKASRVAAAAAAAEGKTPNPIGEPANVRPGGPLEPRPFEYPYSNPPNMVIVPKGAPLNLNALNPKVKYLWVVDGDSNFRFAPEGQNTSDFMKPLPPDKAFKIKHGDLTPGPEGLSRGPARAGGEMRVLKDIDGKPTDMWELNNDSSYTFARVDANGAPLPWAPAESLEAVRGQLVAGGTNPNKLVTTDVLAAERLKAAKK